MAIGLDQLRASAPQWFTASISKSLEEAVSARQRTAFLCHSHLDQELAKGLQVLLRNHGCNVYLDWQDAAMPEKPDRTTAQRIQTKIKELDWFIFLATPSSTASRWCPWEIGYADSAKDHRTIFVVATTDRAGNYYGNEYLQLYQEITFSPAGDLAAYPAGQAFGGRLIGAL